MTKFPGDRRLDPRTLLAIAHDIVVAGVAWAAAYWLRFNLAMVPPYDAQMVHTIGIVVALEVSVFVACGLYRGIWRYASMFDIRRILAAAGIVALAIPTAFVLLPLVPPVPRSVYLINPLLLVLFMGGGRFAYRLWKDSATQRVLRLHGTPLLVLGVNDMAERLVRELASQTRWRAVGLLDHERRRLGRDIHGVRVLGQIKHLARIAEENQVSHAVLAIPPNQHGLRKRAMQIATAAGLRILSVPSFEDLLTGRARITQLKDVEIEDLLGRSPVALESAEVSRMVGGRTVLVTGAGGSIGSELARQIALFKPARLVLLDISEFALFRVEQSLSRQFPNLEMAFATGDVKDASRLADLFSRYVPHIVFHAAAYKHVPLMENENAWEAIRNNVLGTLTLARAAIQAGVDKFVLVSTDKAVNPTNVMGASKRLAEMVCQGLQQEGARTSFIIVRFGNVLGSAGSVVPKFREQISQGGPVTVTHPEVTRYFMSIHEAAQLVLLAGAAGESGQVYVLDMGEPVKIVDLAREMIRLSGLSEEDIPIVFSGLRPGEKLYEELLADDELTITTPHPKLRIAKARPTADAVFARIVDWAATGGVHSDDEVRAILRELLPEYQTGDSSESSVRSTPSTGLRIVASK